MQDDSCYRQNRTGFSWLTFLILVSLLFKIQPKINIVTDDSVLQSRLEMYNRKNALFKLLFTENIFRDHNIGLYVVPAQLYLQYYENNLIHDFYSTPFICYGSAFFIREAFLCGCSDYLKEPWSFDEFEIRAQKNLDEQILTYNWGRLIFRPFFLKTEKAEVPLSLAEYVIFKILALNKGLIIDRHILLGYINKRPGKSYQSVDVHIFSLRKKMKQILPDNIRADRIILTVKNRGYLLVSEE